MNNIYLVRHCKADGQAADVPLTELGVQQANQLAQFLASKQIDSIISSPYTRAYQSIKPLADQLLLEVAFDDRLVERVLSDKNQPNWLEMLRRTYDDVDLFYEGGESSKEAMRRGVDVIMEVLEQPLKNTVIVSHGNLISLLLMHFDERFGFAEWQAMSNPDVYQLSFHHHRPSIQRIWNED
ncbi:histidine phosphatase family protein [Rubeoparvulum massiliense]|uniref:histidine phosphatase family protein n=1 Tax=Rubeoparvulum massiliense TaxID=1631346 RepID=UPI00065DCF28|nr:histidine phosphatase family protein [Rubeoparvulum massiliense]